MLECSRQQYPIDGPTCEIDGDPHYKTFDRYWHHFQGICEYVLTKICGSNEFIISAGNIGHDGSSISCAGFVRIVFPGENIDIVIRRDKSITVNGNAHTCPANGSNVFTSMSNSVTVFCRGGFPYANLTRGIRVFYNGTYRIKISVSTSLQNQLCGLCGTYNFNFTDDLTTPNGTVTPAPHDTTFTVQIHPLVTEFGDSWIIPDPNNPTCTGRGGLTKRNAPGVTGCSTDSDIISGGETRCGVGQQDPFSACRNVVNVTQFIANCYCCCNETEREDCYYDALSSYTSACAEAGVAIYNWRSPTLCHKFIILSIYEFVTNFAVTSYCMNKFMLCYFLKTRYHATSCLDQTIIIMHITSHYRVVLVIIIST